MQAMDWKVRDWKGLVPRLMAAAQALGLDPGPVEYYPCRQPELLALEAYGLPGRFHHWIFGMRYERLHRLHRLGRLLVVEITVGSQPARIYFDWRLAFSGAAAATAPTFALASALAHGLGHADFINRHQCLQPPERRQVPALAPVLAAEARRWRLRWGEKAVEDLLGACLALEHHPHLLGRILKQAQNLKDWESHLAQRVQAELEYLEVERVTRRLNESWAVHWQGRICKEALGLGKEPALPSGSGWEEYGWVAQIACRAQERLGEEGYARLCRQGNDAQLLDLVGGKKPIRPPNIRLVDTNYRGRGYLYLQQGWEGRPLDRRLVPYTLEQIYHLWRRRIYLETWVAGGGGLTPIQFCYPS